MAAVRQIWDAEEMVAALLKVDPEGITGQRSSKAIPT